MDGRRRDMRYRLSKPVQGTFVCFQAIDIEARDEREFRVVSDTPLRRGERMRLELIAKKGRSIVSVRVADSVPTIVDGNVRYRVRLGIVG